MSHIIIPERRVWTRQPQGPVEVDRVRRGLVWLPNSRIDLVSRKAWTLSGTKTPFIKPYGEGVAFSDCEHISGGPASFSELTFIGVVTPAAGAAYRGIFHTSSANNGVALAYDSGNKLSLVFRGVLQFNGVSLTQGVSYAIVTSWRPSQSYILARPITGGAILRAVDALPGVPTAGDGVLRVGRGWDAPWLGDIGLAVVSSSFLPESAANSLLHNPWQIFRPRTRQIIVDFGAGGGGNVYTISPTGSISLLGSVTQLHEKSLTTSGSIALTGTNLITFTNGATTYTIIPSGSVTLSGTNETNRYHLLVPQGNITLSGNAVERKTWSVLPTGSIDFTGDATTAEVKIFAPNGTITFNGTAQLYMPGMEIESTKLPLTGVGS